MDGLFLSFNGPILVPLSFFLPLAFLIVASIQDWYHREVSDWLWVVMLFIGVPVMLVRLLAEDILLIDFLIASVPPILIAIVLCESGFFGGADAKALICIALTVPTPSPFAQTLWPLYTSFTFGVLTNTILLASLMIFYALCRNIPKVLAREIKWDDGVGVWRKCLILISSYFVSAEEFEKKKAFLLRVNQKKILPHHSEEAQKQLPTPISGQILVTPQLPLMIFIAAGYLLALYAGDVLSRLSLLFLSEL